MIQVRRMMIAAAVALAVGLATAAAALADDSTAGWVSAPALAPPPPTGVAPAPYPVPLGYVGDIEFWAPNRGLLITQGLGVVPEGLYAYNGVDWHQLSTVCGGTDGRIAWAGPDEFWTIADQRPGQVLPSGGVNALQDVSLCHFLNGAVVGSYAMPLDQPDSYQQMNAAACASPSDCWFGGDLDSNGAFHLHWDGSGITEVDSPEDLEIASMTVDGGQIYESVRLQSTDSFAGQTTYTPVLHLINASDASDPFVSLFPTDLQDPSCGDFCPPLPDYGTGDNASGNLANVDPLTLGPFALSSDWRAGAADPQLWAAAGNDGDTAAPGFAGGNAVVLFMQNGVWTQVVPNLVSLPTLPGAIGPDNPIGNESETPAAESVAAEPGEDAAWVVVTPGDGVIDQQAHVDRIALTGADGATVTDQDVLGTSLGVGPRGDASAIACPAPADCWVATSQGWLFHWTDGTRYPQDADLNFAGLITYRPPDSGVPDVVPTTEAPTTDTPPPVAPGITTVKPIPVVHHKPAKPVVTHIGASKLVHRTTLELSFTLSVRARVQLVASRKHKTVAESKVAVLGPGRHTISVALNVHAWPTAIALNAKAVTTQHHT